MTPGINDLLDPSIVYASSGLYTLIDVTTLMSIQSYNDGNETLLWPITSSPVTISLGWISLSVYFSVAFFIIILLCGIQLSKPWLLFLWSILMIVMLLADGIVTVISLRQHQQQAYRTSQQVKILFFVMIIRLIVSLCGIFITVFHFRQLSTAKSEYLNRQRMLLRYHTESVSPSYDGTWRRSDDLLDPSKENSDNHYIPDLPPPMILPRAKVATVQRHPTSTMFHSRTSLQSQSEYINQPYERPLSEYKEDFRHNIPLQERFYKQKTRHVQEL